MANGGGNRVDVGPRLVDAAVDDALAVERDAFRRDRLGSA
jgi:hypothetical protein